MREWKKITIGRVCEITKGKQLNKIELFKSGDYPCLNGGIEPSGYTDKWNTEANTITISEGGNSCGYINFMRTRFWSGGHCYSLLNIIDDIDRSFLYQALKGNEKSIMGLRVGSGLPNIQRKALESFEIDYPTSILEQFKIAEILSTVDKAIKQTEKLIAKYKRIKTGLMQDLLTKGIDDNGNIRSEKTHKFKNSHLGRIPIEWEVKPLTKCSIFLDNLRRPIKESDRQERQGDYPYYGATGVIDYIDDYIFDGELILFGEDGENILSRNLPVALIAKGKFWVNNHAHVIKPNEDMDINFLCNILETIDYAPLNTSTAQPKLTKSKLGGVLIKKPHKNEQEKIARTIVLIDNLIKKEKEANIKNKEIKTGLMQDLLTGNVRVPEELIEEIYRSVTTT